ncbi:chorismate mutase family protein [Prescottella sp. R16]|uniref:chorismate mutase family protein n=1 Tax=Prescottella sp. R16 TaxID=3064529 RepID=UPI00272E929C|nr:chorismate mutase family protein [Prescottella sp. R16]
MDDTVGPVGAETSEDVTDPVSVQQPALTGLRAELDAIDARLLEAVRDRVDVCVRIAEVKRRDRIPMMQPHRVDAVHARAERFAREHGLSPEFVSVLYDVLIAETCRVEDVVIGSGGDSPRVVG